MLDDTSGFNEINAVIIVFLDAGGDRENVGIENDVFRRETHLVNQYAVATLADFHLAFFRVGLT